jgi:hypothetical protein
MIRLTLNDGSYRFQYINADLVHSIMGERDDNDKTVWRVYYKNGTTEVVLGFTWSNHFSVS